MDIHKPKPVHSVREFFGEVGIVILGIVIALIGEQAVEFVHWRDEVASFEAAMTAELQTDDLPQAYARIAIHPCLVRQLKSVVDAIDTNVERKAISALTRGYVPAWRSWDSEAWRTAQSAGVVAHMSVERSLQWEGPYALMPLLQTQADNEAAALPDLQPGGYQTGSLSATERDRVFSAAEKLRQADDLIVHTSSLALMFGADAGVTIPAQRETQIVSQLRGEFGDCVTKPPELEQKKDGRHRLPG